MTAATTTSSPSSSTADMKSLTKKPGDVIKSEEWNKLVSELIILREYVNNMSEGMTFTGLVSSIGTEFDLDSQDFPGLSYGMRAIGLITKQWIAPMPANIGEICSFGLTDYFDSLQFWASAENGDKNTLDIVLEYIDGTNYKVGDKLFINNRTTLSARDPAGINPYLEFLKAPYGIWYKYQLRNKFPAKEVRFVKFVNVNKECVPRIANVLHARTKIKPVV